jgi:hypothetical protein
VKLTNRFGVVIAMEMILLLGSGVANAFLDTSKLDELLFHSPLFHVLVFVACWLVAPYFARLFRISDGS